ncbi:zinc ion binding [Ascochyta rabiei]|uniref:Zinc ion binding n=1 Tax=Didymella rabiei TaxID=5454 RepID=A0A163CC93_DIDRA|nr:zinc ion binding [Ascochyta rabiei]
MSTPSSVAVESGALQRASASSASSLSLSPAANDNDNDMDGTGDIPLKVLYTFDDQNKSNCLARLPNALSVPVVSLDENTQVGVIELKTCIQAIVAASPELTAKLGHDYTVYAYDFSEYETPLVGQGMLSWILASASATPNAPAEDSQTMVTGRVCNNILGLFSNGIKETLEVKLKLVPVPTSMQKEYVENMERYHSLSKIMPEGFDYSAWSDFLKENPTLGQLAQPTPDTPAQPPYRSSTGGYEPFHQMLTRHSPSQEPVRNDSFYKQSNASFMSQPSRASSPANSNASFRHVPYNPGPRPNSRASVRSEMSTHSQQYQADPHYIIERQEDGPPKKRARITQATRPRNTPLTARNDSLHKTAATASSVWLHRPIAVNAASNLADAELHPRAPTPRPDDMAFETRGPRRPPAPSALRHGSMDAGRPYASPYDASAFSDAAADSGDDDRDGSPDDTPRDMPSSPPVVSQRTSPTPSSPALPTFPLLNDSGFVSDVPLGRDENNTENGNRIPDGSDLPMAPEIAQKRRQQNMPPCSGSHYNWKEVTPGPTERLPQTYIPPPRSFSRAPYKQVTQSIEAETGKAKTVRSGSSRTKAPSLPRSQTLQEGSSANVPAVRMRQPPTDSFPFPPLEQSQSTGKAGSPDSMMSQGSPGSEAEGQIYSREATPNLPAQRPRTSKSRGLPRSHTWSGTGEPMSDAPTPSDYSMATETKAPRSGSHAKRKKFIKDKLQNALATGDMPDHCHNCGEIETPTWRKSYTRIEFGTPEGIELSSAGIVAYEVIEPTPENGNELMYRVYRNNITNEEKQFNMYETLNLCNPCGLWLVKKGHSRPQRVWDKSSKPAKRRNPGTSTRTKPLYQNDDIASDAYVPHSDAMGPDEQHAVVASFDGQADKNMPPPSAGPRASSPPTNSNDAAQAEAHADAEAEAALQRAIHSSPAGFRRNKDSSIDVDSDLTPRPTRRLLFSSPRKNGETKSLDFAQASSTTSNHHTAHSFTDDREEEPERPRCERCKRLKRGCDRKRPCGRCTSSGLDYDDCIPCKMPKKTWFDHPVVPVAPVAPVLPVAPAVSDVSSVAALSVAPVAYDAPPPVPTDEEEIDKENCPPPVLVEEQDDIAYLFETPGPAKTTPRKDAAFLDLLKTPTPGSRRRVALTPRRSADDADKIVTPSRSIFTPRTMRSATVAPETPFTRQLNAMLSDAMNSSPSQIVDFSAFPVFGTPGRTTGAQFSDFINDDFLSSDMPLSSSPAKAGMFGHGFDLYEDPNTSSVGLWNDANMFGNDAMMLDVDNDTKGGSDTVDGAGTTAMLKMTVGGITVDFASMIEEVVGNNDDNADAVEGQHPFPDVAETLPCPEVTKTQLDIELTRTQTSPEATSQGLAQTPEAPEVE